MTAVRSRGRLLWPLGLLLCIAAAVPWFISLSGIDRAQPHHYAKRSVDGRRKLDLVYERSYQYEATFEKCGIQSMPAMAAGLHVPATATAVARAYSQHHAPAIRRVVYNGCRDAFLDRWNPPPDDAP